MQKTMLLLLVLAAMVYLAAVGVDTMDEDASQYATMSREMMESGSYLQVYENGQDYLDKPPFLFWINAVSMQLLGPTNLAFKLPSLLFALLAVFATYRLAALLYDSTIAAISALVLAGCQVLFLITNDIRTDTILMGWVTLSLWLLTGWLRNQRPMWFLLGAAAIGGGMITKGPIALLVPVFAIGSQVLLQRQWQLLFRPIYLAGIVVIAIILLPMSVGLYQQFDLHPEKTVNGAQGVSGLRFFYWTQSFGRITGESVWNNHAPFSFLFENLLWGMLPWTLFFIAGLLSDWWQLIRSRFVLQPGREVITSLGFLLTYCSLAVSKYQLPHYIYVVLPLVAISTAKSIHAAWWVRPAAGWARVLSVVQYIVLAVLLVAPFAILVQVFPTESIWVWVVPVLPVVVVCWMLFTRTMKQRLFYASFATIVGVNLFLSLWFYPQLLQLQAGNVVGRMITERKVPAEKFFMYRYNGSARNLHFYSRRIVTRVDSLAAVAPGTYLLTMNEGIQELEAAGRRYNIVHRGSDYHVTALTLPFLNKDTRATKVKSYLLVQVLN